MLSGIASGVAVAGIATWLGFESMWPTMSLYGRAFTGLPPGTRQLALTYDDGPNDPDTLRLLDVLAKHDVKATFFVLGRFVEQKPEIVSAVAKAGHVIGNHSWDHPRLIFASNAELTSQVERTQDAILDACSVLPTLFRPPYGGRRPGTFHAVRQLGLEPVMWNVTCYDWKATSGEQVFAHAKRQIRGGNVILLHDGDQARMGADRSHSIEATDRLITHYKTEGYEFVTIPQMIKTLHYVQTTA
jgi:peptidoglycan/xylan/chitin deacetylase (PgdA/CDA1 family)